MNDNLLNQPKEVLWQMLQNALDAFVVIDTNSTVIAWTRGAEALFGWTAQEAVGKTVGRLIIPPDLREAHTRGMRRYLETGQTSLLGKRVEIHGQHKDKHIFPVELSITPITINGTLHFSAALRDITERQQKEQALREADRQKDEFLAMLAHELRNPLAPISTAAELLRVAQLGEEQVKHSSEVIARQAQHMVQLIDDLLDVSRVTRGLIHIEKSRLELLPLLSDAIEQVRGLVEQRGHRLHLDLPPRPLHVQGNHTRLVQVFTNLLANARYTPDGGDISLTVAAVGAQADISISDNGVGIPADLLPHVFDLFVQGARRPDRTEGGLGLGLALVKKLVELHGGSVRGESEGTGRGSTFTVRLPLAQGMPAPTRTERRADGTAAESNMPCVMIVDDNLDAAQMLAMLLESHGYTVLTATSASAALDLAVLVRPGALLLDIGLPDMDGYELAREIRRRPQLSEAVLIAVTGYGRPEDIARAKDAGFDHHLLKPVSIPALLSLLESVHGKRDTGSSAPPV